MQVDDNVKSALNQYIDQHSIPALLRESKIKKRQITQWISGDTDEIVEKDWDALYQCLVPFLPTDITYWPRPKLESTLAKQNESSSGKESVESTSILTEAELGNDEIRLLKLYRTIPSKIQRNMIQHAVKLADGQYLKDKKVSAKLTGKKSKEFETLAERVVVADNSERPPKTTELNLQDLYDK